MKSAGCSEIALFVILVTALLPSPALKICIAPGDHIALENVDSECCGFHGVPCPLEPHTQNLGELTGDCGDCTDIMLAFGQHELIQKSQIANGLPAVENPDVLPPADLFSSSLRQNKASGEVQNPNSSSLPLLC
jgi:hypothetical protein